MNTYLNFTKGFLVAGLLLFTVGLMLWKCEISAWFWGLAFLVTPFLFLFSAICFFIHRYTNSDEEERLEEE
jgi:hypothetical protein